MKRRLQSRALREAYVVAFHRGNDECLAESDLREQYTLTLTEEENWQGSDGVTKDKVMLVNGMHIELMLLSVSLTLKGDVQY